MKVTSIIFSAVAMLAATVAAAPSPEAAALDMGATFDSLNKRYCCKPSGCYGTDSPCYVSERLSQKCLQVGGF